MVKLVNKVFALLDAEAMQIVARICLVIIAIVKIHVKKTFAVQTLYAISKIMLQNVIVQPVLKEIHRQSRDVFEYRQHVSQQVDARMVTCALQTFAKYHAQIMLLVPLVKDAIIMFVPRFATPITIVYQAKFVTNAEHVNRVA